jgi:hypothetical protein
MKIHCIECNKIVCADEYSAYFCSYWCEEKWKNKNKQKMPLKYIKANETDKGGKKMIFGNPKTISIIVTENNKFVIQYQSKNIPFEEGAHPMGRNVGMIPKVLVANTIDELQDIVKNACEQLLSE